MEAKTTFESVEEYLESLPAVAAERLRELSQVVSEEMPGAEQVISYGIPTFRLDGKNLVHIAGYKRHVGLYGTSAMEALEAEVAPYRTGKGTLQFLHSEPLPVPLIRKIVAARVREHRAQRAPWSRPVRPLARTFGKSPGKGTVLGSSTVAPARVSSPAVPG